MKRWIKKLILRVGATVLFITGLLLIVILNPVLTYAKKRTHGQFTIFHSRQVDDNFISKLDIANELLKRSEFYEPDFKLSICLNDGSLYPEIIQTIRGRAFAWGFYDIVVLQGSSYPKQNHLELNGYKWNLAQLLAHEMTHCLQFEHFGFWKSNPVANVPIWKWEGYAEYLSRPTGDQKNLILSIDKFLASDKNDWEMELADGTMVPREYFKYWILLSYCMDVKKMTYQQIILDETSEKSIYQEVISWYKTQ